ncbi:ferritin-like domain-containing protein [Anaerobacillus isosaccharinicus]|uniref:Ferritin-like domain-containing protein n=1 Tax=Anaerobacillus isosaccharinicus TaxID=1532552 RepID=A0A1S2LBB6_9BACI|nr:ferritin-like domain-containing protein [Anaerobacillus isosaccharinicus]MBA5588150.1 ferritin-like domain-containing protein [Anaerobacillus isosaccharinicus]QOY38396.1 ferritin-like domain-containing protein [Anaerobacillus isosaccharinicus]
MAETIVKELNEFLKGQYMGIHSYEHYIQKLQDPDIKREFQKIQQEHKQHAMLVAERIQNLGGTPVDDEGILGSMQGFLSQLNLPDTTEGLIQGALKGESIGIKMSEEIVKGDLDGESRQLIEEILDDDRQHTSFLTSLLQ